MPKSFTSQKSLDRKEQSLLDQDQADAQEIFHHADTRGGICLSVGNKDSGLINQCSYEVESTTGVEAVSASGIYPEAEQPNGVSGAPLVTQHLQIA